MESIFLPIGGAQRLLYRKAGAGPTIVLLHGFPENGTLWDSLIPALSDSFQLLIPDLPGSGESDLPAGELSMDAMAAPIRNMLDAEGVEQAVIAGHSMGGYTALAFADAFPERVKGLSLVHSTAYADSEEKKIVRRKSIELIRKGGKEPFVKQMIPNLFYSGFVAAQQSVVNQQIARGVALDDSSMISFYTAMINRPDRTHVLINAAFPVQWVVGEEDQLIDTTVALQQSRLSGVTFVSLFSECGHMSMLEMPDRLANDLLEFANYCNYSPI